MTHIVAGYPTLKKSEETALIMANAGVGYIEIQIPFSDPIADGPTIMKACEVAIKNGIKVEDSFKLMKRLHDQVSTPLLFMSYFNILHHYGVEAFCKRAKNCGCYGLIVPDIPIDEEKYEGYLAACKKYKIKAIQVISPLTPEKRLKKIAGFADGFVYCVSKFGTTGASATLNPKLSSYLKKAKKYIKLPLAVGFGISQKEHVEAVFENAEIAVIGSKIINLLDEGGDLRKFIEGLGS